MSQVIGQSRMLRLNPSVRQAMMYARWDAEDALRERNPDVKRLMRDRVHMYAKFARIRLHRLMREARRG